MSVKASIIISSHDRLPLLRRTLYGIATRPPTVPFEVVICDDGSTEDVLGELRTFGSRFRWKFIRFDAAAFERATGLKKFLNNPCVTNNIAFKHAEGVYVFQQGNEVIPWRGVINDNVSETRCVSVYDKLIDDHGKTDLIPMVMSTTYDVGQQQLDRLDSYGSNLHQGVVDECLRWPLQSSSYPSDVTNYISLACREVWEAIGGYDERYYGGISSEDSDFVRRFRALGGDRKVFVSEGVSLHQFHNGKTRYYDPPPRVITAARWKQGVDINHAVYHAWDGTHHNRQKWPWGTLGVGEVITNA